jgi:hypothetical protein
MAPLLSAALKLRDELPAFRALPRARLLPSLRLI